MSATIRLTRMGRKKHPFYRLVVLDSRSRRDGAYIEKLGHYNPFVEPYEIEVDHDKTIAWLEKGAGMSDTARALLRNEGVLYRWHLKKSGASVADIESKVEEYRSRHGSRLDLERKKRSEARANEAKKREDAEKAYLKAKMAKAEGGEAAPQEDASAQDAPAEAGEETKAAPSEEAQAAASEETEAAPSEEKETETS
jgi:small subunit ribosomal protein S16